MSKDWWNDKASPNKAEVGKLVQTGWTALAQDKTIGKRIAIAAQTTNEGVIQGNSLNILQIAAPNEFAQQLQIVLSSPHLVPDFQFPGGIVPMDGTIQDASGDRDNYDFYLHQSPGPLNVSWRQAIAVIEWGIGGVQYRAEVDFLNGLCINIVASWVRVGAFLDAISMNSFDAEVIVTGGAYIVSAFIGPGYPKANNAQRTFYVGDLSASDSLQSGYPLNGFGNVAALGFNLYPVPYFGKTATIIASRHNGSGIPLPWDLDLVFFRDVRSQFSLGHYHFTPDIREPCTVPNGAMYFSVHNRIPGDPSIIPPTTPVSVVFELAI